MKSPFASSFACLWIVACTFFIPAYCSSALCVDSAAGSGSINILARDYSIHPVLGTKPGEHYKGDLTAINLDKLCCKPDYRGGMISFDPSYLEHEPAELDAAEALCRLALASKFNTYRPTNLDPGYLTEVKLTVGFNQIPLELTYRGFDCIAAECGSAIQRRYKGNCPHNRRPRPEILKHTILGTSEFCPLGEVIITDAQFKELNSDPVVNDHDQFFYIGSSDCFRKAECAVALQFRDHVLGLTDLEILKIAGEPSIKTGGVLVWGDSDKYKKNWVYYFGYSGVPVRLVFKDHKCIGSAVLSSTQQSVMFEYNIFRFSSRRPDEIAMLSKTTNDSDVRRIGNFDCLRGNPEGKSRAEILETFGEPQSISQDSEGHPLYIYGTGRFAHVEIPIVNDRAYGRISHDIRIAW